MTRPTRVHIDTHALIHNLKRIKSLASNSKVIAMVKANAYGTGLSKVLPTLEGQVDAFGVASCEEAVALRKWGSRTPCILFQGVFSPAELSLVDELGLGLVIHSHHQLDWLQNHTFKKPIRIWIKINTGMNRLGFLPEDLPYIFNTLKQHKGIEKPMGIMSHFACADEPAHPQNLMQLNLFEKLTQSLIDVELSMANSAAILSLPQSHYDWVRPGIMLYGVSPFKDKTAKDLGLKPVMSFHSAISSIYALKPHAKIGYGATFSCDRDSLIGIIPVGYGDGYPRHLYEKTEVYLNGQYAPIVGRVSMDMLTVDLTDIEGVKLGTPVELWGKHVAVERVAKSADTLAYELLCQISPRARDASF